jgi:hypothetical protein
VTKERFFTIIDLPATVSESYFVFGTGIWWIQGMKVENAKGEWFSINDGDEVFEKYWHGVAAIDLIEAILKQTQSIIHYANEKVRGLFEMLKDEYEENICALEDEVAENSPYEPDELRG